MFQSSTNSSTGVLVGGEADEQAVAAEALVDEVVLDDLALAAEGDQEVLVAEGRNRSS
jgi:hypothetical protein